MYLSILERGREREWCGGVKGGRENLITLCTEHGACDRAQSHHPEITTEPRPRIICLTTCPTQARPVITSLNVTDSGYSLYN